MVTLILPDLFPAVQAVNGIAWSSAAWVIIMESQALTIRPAGVALCITCSGMGMALIEAKLLCQLNWYYYIVILALSVISLVSENSMIIADLMQGGGVLSPSQSVFHSQLTSDVVLCS